jgi:hypothetical protein
MTSTLEAANVSVVRRFIDEVVNGGNLAVVEETWAEDMTWNGGSLGSFERRRAYITIHDVVAHDDKVVLRFTNSGTNSGAFMGRPATNRHAEWLGIGIYTIREGRITEGWFAEDILGMLLQLGAVALPA